MKAIIDTNGWLEIEKGPGYVQQWCINDSEARCGHWCPFFKNPLVDLVGGLVYLELCDEVLTFSKLEDKREKRDEIPNQ